MNKEQLMNKVNKLLALAGNNPSQQEANAAFAKAQKLIAEYNLNMDEFKNKKEEIVMMPCEHPNNNGYRTTLSVILGKNFRCRPMMCGNTVNFVGYKTDVEVCVQVFNYAYKVSRRNGQRLERQARKEGRSAHGIFNSYVQGFMAGIREVLDEQCRALMIIVPDEVEKHADEMSGGRYKGGMRRTCFSSSSYNEGKADGRAHMRSREIEFK